MVTLLGSRHVRIGKVLNLSLCFVRLCARHLPSSRGDICAGCLSLRVQNSARCGIEEVVLCLGARMRLDTDISCLLSTGVQQSTRTRNLLMRQVAVVLELRRGLLPAMGPSLSSYRSIVALKVQKSMVEAVAKVPTRKDSQYKRVHTTDLYYRGWTAHRAPSTEANLVPEVGASQLCSSTSFARPVETRFLRHGHGPQGRCRGHRQFLQ
ncbi:uncharacterized protein [Dermacentor andersoni]|uniref:uncharacterized protein n=1 Tax=Dermacentor andersoni TaxID=34620 RepID=UPI0021553F18|nr:uncharacterized protein LOC126536900 [Dermacentor andersoni]XP_054929570.1 uncharacterized protein LOC126536900 [Dermacentor andersoni]